MSDNMFGYVKVLYRAAIKSMHSTRLSDLLSVETTVSITNVVTHRAALSYCQSVKLL